MVDSGDYYPPNKVTVINDDYDEEVEADYWKRIIELCKKRSVLMTEEVVPYKKYIRKVVELSTMWEINRWDNWKSDYYLDFFNDELIAPKPKQNRFLPWLLLLSSIATFYFILSPWLWFK